MQDLRILTSSFNIPGWTFDIQQGQGNGVGFSVLWGRLWEQNVLSSPSLRTVRSHHEQSPSVSTHASAQNIFLFRNNPRLAPSAHDRESVVRSGREPYALASGKIRQRFAPERGKGCHEPFFCFTKHSV